MRAWYRVGRLLSHQTVRLPRPSEWRRMSTRTDDGQLASFWHVDAAPTPLPRFPALTTNIDGVDACVVGAGIAGLTTAYMLASEGRSVVLLEDGAIASGESGRTTAHLMSALDDRFYMLEKIHGEAGARLAAESHRAAIDLIETICQREQIDCEFQRLDGYLYAAPHKDTKELETELKAARRCGMDVELMSGAPVPFHTGPALRFRNQGRFHPLRYYAGLVNALVRRGVRIHCDTHVASFDEACAGAPDWVEVRTTSGARVRARHLALCTNVPVNERLLVHTKQEPYRTYAIAMTVPASAVPADVLLWDTGDPYVYVRLASARPLPSGELVLIVGGEDHHTGSDTRPQHRFDRLERWTRQRYPGAGAVLARWSGQVVEPADGLAFIGRNPGLLRSHSKAPVWIATGDSGTGMTHGTIAGRLLTDLMAGRPNPWAELYDPARLRLSLHSLKENVLELVHQNAPFVDWVTPGDVRDIEDVPRGCGAILRRGLSKVAVYRDDDDTVHAFSAVCPHLGGLVRWNTAERTFDCPCHGSRFSRYGHVLNGPANRDLRAVALPAGAAAPRAATPLTDKRAAAAADASDTTAAASRMPAAGS